MAQYRRFGYLKSDPNYQSLAGKLILTDLYKEVAKAEGVPVPKDDMTKFRVKLDNAIFHPANPKREARWA